MGLLNFLSKKTNIDDTVAVIKGKSNNELVAEIHETFNTEVDRLLKEAGILKPLPDTDTNLLNKADRLKVLGFNNTVEAKEASRQSSAKGKVESHNGAKNKLKETIEYFSNKYPMYKFITEESVVKICEKYNLIYGDVSNYIGDVPDKNLSEIENFKIDEKDELWEEQYISYTSMRSRRELRYMNKEEAKKRNEIENNHRLPSFGSYKYSKSSMEIAAPLKDFNTEGMEIENFKLSKIEIPDPVVLYPVFRNNQKYYLIVTAWGEEASDELVVNQNFN